MVKKEIAVYGKGGIGKSTLSANISAALAKKGQRVLQIGCDPKHDSTRLLMGGMKITTVLDYIKSTLPLDYKLEHILFKGYSNIGCIEAGGPEPGVGCAGRGIITVFELLEKFHIKENYDMILYDVLGDVVCGGFAVPIRREYADTIFLVTSGEYMSLYAANNILRGIKNYDDSNRRVAGILYNSRNVKNEDSRVSAFARAVGLPIVAKIPRDDIFARAERNNCTVLQLPDTKESLIPGIFESVADVIVNDPPLYEASPLTDDRLEEVVMGSVGPVPALSPACTPAAEKTVVTQLVQGEEDSYESGYLSKNVIRNEPLHGCAFNGAISMSVHLTDTLILAHSPKSCTYLTYQTISSSGRRTLFERGTLLPASIMPNIISTDMDETDMVFGGTDKLLAAVERIKNLPEQERPKAVVIVSSCPAGIIGDDINKAKALSTPELPVITIKADGNLTGDYLQGMLESYTQLARQIIDPSAKPVPDTVNIVFEKVVAKNTESNFRIMEGFLRDLGLRVNCRFLCNTNYNALKTFCSSQLNLLAHKDYTGVILQDFFTKEYGCRFFEHQFPVGFMETEQWITDLADYFHRPMAANEMIASAKSAYQAGIHAVRPALEGKKLMIITYNHELDWILKTAIDAGMEIVKLCILNFSQDEGFRSALPEVQHILREENYDTNKRSEDIHRYQPDILLSNYESSAAYGSCIADTIPMCPDVGFFSGLIIARRWVNLFDMNLEGEWKDDQQLFNKYYSR